MQYALHMSKGVTRLWFISPRVCVSKNVCCCLVALSPQRLARWILYPLHLRRVLPHVAHHRAVIKVMWFSCDRVTLLTLRSSTHVSASPLTIIESWSLSGHNHLPVPHLHCGLWVVSWRHLCGSETLDWYYVTSNAGVHPYHSNPNNRNLNLSFWYQYQTDIPLTFPPVHSSLLASSGVFLELSLSLFSFSVLFSEKFTNLPWAFSGCQMRFSSPRPSFCPPPHIMCSCSQKEQSGSNARLMKQNIGVNPTD